MEIKDLQGKLVAVLGYGLEGKATAAYLLKHGVTPVLFDQRPFEQWPVDEQNYIKSLQINFIFGPDAFMELAGFDVAFRSPGIRLSDLQLTTGNSDASVGAPTLKGRRGLQLTSQTKWFFDNCPAKIIGVTGTKGKGTTCALINDMLKTQNQSGKSLSRTFLTGNIGKVQPLEFLDGLDQDDWVVYELSSFQLQDLEKSPHIAVVLMVLAEHLDYHKNVKDYHEAKIPIVKFQNAGDIAIINHDFPASMAIGAFGKGKKLFFSRQKAVKPGCFVKDDDIVMPDSNFSAKGGFATGGQLIIPISSLQLKGLHNLENVCAAVLASTAAGCGPGSIKKAAKKFKGLEHRLEYVCDVDRIKYYDDSFSTTPETTIAAVKSFTEPLILILGGSSKNSEFTELGKVISGQKNIKAVILIGREAGKIKDAITKAGEFSGKILEEAKSMPEIFKQALSTAQKGDVVLLSPACASFGMFKNYVDRGQQFKDNVLSLKRENGQS